jgi:3-oxoacyl-[acyl-carrier protein] reductase
MNQEKSPGSLPETVLLTGATRGLGLAAARRLVNEGYQVIGMARSRTAEFDQLCCQESDQVGQAHFLEYDLANLEGIHELVNDITRKFGAPYAIVNNAAVGVDGVLATMHARDIERVLRVNLHAPIHLIKYASRAMMIRRRGRIVNISSIIAGTGFSGLSVYAASKSALEGMTKSLARELGRVGITVNCVAPGYMETDMTNAMSEDKLLTVKRRSPLGLATVEDVARAICFLLGPDAARITGTVLTVDGGSTA